MKTEISNAEYLAQTSPQRLIHSFPVLFADALSNCQIFKSGIFSFFKESQLSMKIAHSPYALQYFLLIRPLDLVIPTQNSYQYKTNPLQIHTYIHTTRIHINLESRMIFTVTLTFTQNFPVIEATYRTIKSHFFKVHQLVLEVPVVRFTS